MDTLYKKLMLSAAFIVMAPVVAASNSAQKLVEFKALKVRWCNEWLQLMADETVQKTKLLKKEALDWSKFGQKAVKQLNSATNFSKERDQWFADMTQQAIDLYKEHRAEWKEWMMKKSKTCEEIAVRQESELAAFEESLAGKSVEVE